MIRNIWAFTLSLIDLNKNYDSLNHLGLLIYDEPRQQNIEENDAKNLYKKIIDILEKKTGNFENKYQIIIATSDKKEFLEKALNLGEINFVERGFCIIYIFYVFSILFLIFKENCKIIEYHDFQIPSSFFPRIKLS